MAFHYTDLMEYLLMQIGLCGPEGATAKDILTFIDDFYADGGNKGTVDRQLKKRIWQWLTWHPAVSVGDDRRGNSLDLDQFEQLQDDNTHNIGRVSVTEDYQWLAVAGHTKDHSQVPPSEWQLLRIITSSKEQGILQTDLIRESGQDKRSVPKRTDMLKEKGYIQKRPVQARLAKTTLLLSWRYPVAPTIVDPLAERPTTLQPPPRDIVDLQELLEKIFMILKSEPNRIISRDDLKGRLSFNDRWRWKVLSRAILKLENIGCLRRVRANSQYQVTEHGAHPCILMVREPTKQDIQLFLQDSAVLRPKEEERDEDIDLESIRPEPAATEGAMEVETVEEPALETVQESGQEQEKSIEQMSQAVADAAASRAANRRWPLWHPDRMLYNLIFDVIHDAGVSGRTTNQAMNDVVGRFFRRPLETVLTRLVEGWQLQPLHLRHLAIVRDMALQGTITHYVYISARWFKALVDAGQTSWDVVAFQPRDTKSQRAEILPPDAEPDLDEDGLPAFDYRKQRSEMPLIEAMAKGKPTNYTITGSDPVAVRLSSGIIAPKYYSYHRRLKSAQQMTESREPTPVSEQTRELTTMTPTTKYPAKPRHDQDRLASMSEKEILEAQGMDESWTRYHVHLIERPRPGVYFTPRGKDRPAGHARGRPRISRIGIFKSPQLRSLPWFTEETRPAEGGEGIKEIQLSDQAPRRSLRRRATRQLRDHEDEEEREEDVSESPRDEEVRPSRQETAEVVSAAVKLGTTIDGQIQELSESTVEGSVRKLSVGPSIMRSVNHQADVVGTPGSMAAPLEHEWTDEETRAAETVAVDVSTARTAERDTMASETPASSRDVTRMQKGKQPVRPSEPPPSEERQAQGGAHPRKRARVEKGGSVAYLRRSIILEIVEKAGGAFPLGNELWNPFVTLWRERTQQKEMPDLRTIKAAVKSLVDSGQLLQTTFAGKDAKDVMVVRDIIRLPHVPVDSPVMTDLQHNMLKTKNFVPEGVEIDPSLKKTSKGDLASQQRGKNAKLPFQSDVTVQLQEKPRYVVELEKRYARRIVRAMLGMKKPVRLRKLTKRTRDVQQPEEPTAPPAPPAHEPDEQGASDVDQENDVEELSEGVPSEESDVEPLSPSSYRTGQKRRMHETLEMANTSLKRKRTIYYNPDMYSIEMEALSKPFPKSLDDILSDVRKRRASTYAGEMFDPRTERFFLETDDIARWELQNALLFERRAPELIFLNQTVGEQFEAAQIEGELVFQEEQVLPSQPPKHMRMRLRPQRPLRNVYQVDGQLSESTQQSWPPPKVVVSDEQSTQVPEPQFKPPVRRRVRFSSNAIDEELMTQLMHVMVIVRTLVGGIPGRVIDWNLVVKAFPEHDPQFIRERGRAILSRDRHAMAKMQRDFQSRYLEAYRAGTVPPINYNNLEEVDWRWLAQWNIEQSETTQPSRGPDLPATHSEFDELFEAREEPPAAEVDQIFSHATPVAMIRKENVLSSVIYAELVSGTPNPTPSQRRRQAELDDLNTAKSWVRANTVADERTYVPADAKRQLQRFPTALVDDALRSLVTERVLTASNKGRTVPGRNFVLSDLFFMVLGRKRAIDAEMLLQASYFKQHTLDDALRRHGVWEITYHAEDGDILAIINLAQDGAVTIEARDPPRDAFGLTDGGYLTRVIEKKKFHFAVEVRPVEGRYVYGNPVWERIAAVPPPRGDIGLSEPPPAPAPPTPPPPPASSSSSTSAPRPAPILPAEQPSRPLPGKMPLWIDINRNLVKDIWDRAVAAVVGIIAVRPHIKPGDIVSMTKPSLAIWDVKYILEWLTQVGLARQTESGGYVVEKWWWMVLV